MPPSRSRLEKPTSAGKLRHQVRRIEPDVPSSSSHGFMVCPPNPDIVGAPARPGSAWRRAPHGVVENASPPRRPSWGRGSGKSRHQVVGIPAVSRRSFAPQGMPCSGRVGLACGQGQFPHSLFAWIGAARAERDNTAQPRIESLQSLEIKLVRRSENDFSLLDPAEVASEGEWQCLRPLKAMALDPPCSDKSVAPSGPCLHARKNRIPPRPGESPGSSEICRGTVRRSLECRHGIAPVACRLRTVGGGPTAPCTSFSALGEGPRRHFGSDA